MVMNPSFNGTSISNGTRLSFDVPSPLSSPRLIHFPNPNILKQGYGGYNIGNTLSTTLPYPRCHTTMRKSRHFVPNECKDEYYWHKRLKNNEAARKSRQKRRTIDSVLEEKVLILLHENQLLRQELYAMKVKYGEIVPTPEHQQEPSSSADNMMDCSQKMKKSNERGVGDNVALTNKLISQALAKSDEKRIGLRQSLLETINMSLSKENDGKHKMLSQHHASLADNESMLYGNNNKQMTNGMTSSQSQASAAKFPNELLSNLASGAYVLTSLSPGSEDMACLPSSINGCSAASMRSAEQHMLINCRIPSSVGMVTSQSYQQQQGDCCADEKAMEAANTLANLLKRSGSTHSSTSSIDQPLSPGSPPTPNMSTNSNSSSENHPMSHHPMHACPPQSPVQQHLIIQQQHQHHLQQQQQQQQRQLDQMMKTNENNYHQQHLLQQQQQQQHHNGGNNSTSTTPVHSPVPSSKHEVNPKQCLPHKLRFKENKNV